MNSPHESIRIIRPVAEQSLGGLEFAQDVEALFPNRGVRGRPALNLTLIGTREFRSTDKQTVQGPRLPMQDILFPVPDTGRQQHTFEVIDARFMGQFSAHRALSLIIDDPESILNNERGEYMRRLGHTIWRDHNDPHVSIADVGTSYATSDMVKWLNNNAPSTITLESITTEPFIERLKQLKGPAPKPRKEQVHSISGPYPEVRRLGDAKIPEIFLKSLRPRTTQSEPID
ncbi:MAG: hypothetical protein ABIP50_03585 [Candidatus Saccharimonadales bacterium]